MCNMWTIIISCWRYGVENLFDCNSSREWEKVHSLSSTDAMKFLLITQCAFKLVIFCTVLAWNTKCEVLNDSFCDLLPQTDCISYNLLPNMHFTRSKLWRRKHECLSIEDPPLACWYKFKHLKWWRYDIALVKEVDLINSLDK